MSRMPDKEGVALLRQTAIRHRSLTHEIETLEDAIRRSNERRKVAAEELAEAREALVSQLEAMDCRATGNHGYESRIAWMLGEFDRQASSFDPATVRGFPELIGVIPNIIEQP